MRDHPSNITSDLEFVDEEPTDACWKSLTENGNMLFREGKYHQAEKFYEVALKEAEDIFLSAQIGTVYRDADPAPMLIASATNLAENQLRNGDGTKAYKTLSAIVDRLASTLSDRKTPKELIDQCAYHMGYAVIRLATVMRSLGASKETISIEIEGTKKAFLNAQSQQTVTQH